LICINTNMISSGHPSVRFWPVTSAHPEGSHFMSLQISLGNDATPQRLPTHSDRFEHDLVALIPHLRAFSRLLCGRQAIAEDLAQETLAKAWRARERFEPGTNMKAWLFTILRNAYYSYKRRAWRESSWDAKTAERIQAPPNEQDWAAELSDTVRALRKLPDAQRDAVLLVGAAGLTYKEASATCGTGIGTLKSRVARGREALLSVLDSRGSLRSTSLPRGANALQEIQDQMAASTSRKASRVTHARVAS
jgi:RNA polymerase sigma-70 factor (ECF subfamily)